jgi:acylphosphatase
MSGSSSFATEWWRQSTEPASDGDTRKVSRRVAKHYIVRGRVQGVGFRSFVEYSARPIGVTGWVRNLDDGSVEVYAAGTPDQLSQFEDVLWRGPRMSDVRALNAREEVVDSSVHGFFIRY